jgi:phosphate transport system permease protein
VAYGLIVVPLQSFSAIAGAVALSIIMIPIIVKTTEESVRSVPSPIKEAAFALGAPRWKVTFFVVFPVAWSGIFTGIVLSSARIVGETAPLLFTAFGNMYWNWNPLKPIEAMPLLIFNYAISPYDDWHRQAWTASLLLVAFVLVASSAIRFWIKRRASF